MELYVDPTGRDGAPGTREKPLATPHGARDALRQRRREGLPPDTPVTFWFAPGVYRFEQSLRLEAADSGTSAAPVCWRAMPGAEVRWTGAISIDPAGFTSVRDPAIRERLSSVACDRVICLDLAALGITDAGGRLPHGFAHPEAAADPDLYDADQPLPLARWPRNEYAVIGEVVDPGTRLNDPAGGMLGPDSKDGQPRGATFYGDRERLRRWRKPSDLSCFGMWSKDWAPSTIPIAATDPERGTLTLATPSCYGVGANPGRRYYVKNIIEEITQPGDWAIDRDAAMLYLLPPRDPEALALTLSALTEPLVVMNATQHVEMRDLIVEGGRFHGIVINGHDHFVGGCTLRNLGGRGLHIHGNRNRVQSCHIYQTGQGGVTLNGGNRRTLEAACNVVDNCEIHDFNRVCMTYNPAVHVGGCGQRVSHNHFYNAPHNAILLAGNDHWIEFNEFDHVAQETDDAAAFYMGRNPSEQGVVVRHNFFHHIGTPSAWGTSAIYPDDGASGLTVYGNVFYRCGHAGQVSMAAIFANGGKDHRIENNIFVDCRLAVGLMLMTTAGWVEFLRGEGRHGYMRTRLYEDVDIRSETYLERYPWLAEIESNPGVNTISRNLLVNCGRLVAPAEHQVLDRNWQTDEDPGFADADHLDFSLSADSEGYRRIPGFEPIPFADIGLRIDGFRHTLPPRKGIDCMLAVKQRPHVSRPGERAEACLDLRIANLSAKGVRGIVDLWSTDPEGLRFPDGTERAFDLPADGVKTYEVNLELTARPDRRQAVGARLRGEVFSLPIPVRPRYHVVLPYDSESLPEDDTRLPTDSVALSFMADGTSVGTLQWALYGRILVLDVHVMDRRVGGQGGDKWTGDGVDWNAQMFGLLMAPPDAKGAEDVRQLVFFPHGEDGGGSVQFYEGIACHPPPEGLHWHAAIMDSGGWRMTARFPLASLGTVFDEVTATGFRFEAMANTTDSFHGERQSVTLFGSRTAQLEIQTLADVECCRNGLCKER